MSRLSVAIACAVVSLSTTGCFGGRPKDVATAPGDSFCELSDLRVTKVNGELHFKVNYLFPDGLPKHQAWFTCIFELQGGNTSSVSVRKAGSELMKSGEFEGVTNASFLRSNSGTLTIQVHQGEKKTGPFRPVSAPLVSGF